MRTDNRWLVVCGGNLLFLLTIAQLNHHLTNFPLLNVASGQVYLFLPGLPLAFAALRFSTGTAMLVSVITALAMESQLPLATGSLLLPATACVCGTLALRGQFNRFEPSTAIVVGLAMNLVLVLALTVLTFDSGGVSVSRIVVDLLVSQLALAVLTGWFFAAQTALLALFGFNLETELREPL